MTLLINIHTHRPHNNDEWSIQNLHADFDQLKSLFNYSVGVHPWYIDPKTIKHEMLLMKTVSQQKNVLAIGECGLDRLCNTDFKLQEKIFTEQIIWANEIAKPLIIHCVRAHAEIFKLLKEHNRISPVIFHGFNNSEELANNIIQKGYTLSFGKQLFNPTIEKVFSKIAGDYFFLETDDSDYTIDAIYKQAAKIRNISADGLSLQIQQNLKRVFNLSKK